MPNRQHAEIQVIDAFFDAYEEYWQRNIAVTPAAAFLAEEISFLHAKRLSLQEPTITAQEIELIVAGNGMEIPDYLPYFFTRYSYVDLDTPLCRFPQTTDTDVLAEMVDLSMDRALIPIAWSREYDDHILGISEKGHVVAFSYVDQHADAFVVCGSFMALLKILTILLELEQFEWYGDLSADDEVTIERLRRVDPEFFGGQAWNWWRGQLIRPN